MSGIVIPVVREIDGIATADSRDVAEYFGKQHKHVLRDIRNLLKDIPNLTVQFWAVKFNNRGREFDCYRMTKTGFLMLVMGFTGTKASQLKLAYIEEFDRMQDSLRHLWDREYKSLMEAANELGRIESDFRRAASAGGRSLARWRNAKPKIKAEFDKLQAQGQLLLELEPGRTTRRVIDATSMISYVAPKLLAGC